MTRGVWYVLKELRKASVPSRFELPLGGVRQSASKPVCRKRSQPPDGVSMTTSLKIPGAVIPRSVFTQPGPNPVAGAKKHDAVQQGAELNVMEPEDGLTPP
jgi:hypothetical protein